jgi:DNA-binding MurR/RpiR family transcriptional regulator
MTDCILKLKELMDTFSPAEQRVAAYFLSHHTQLTVTPIQEVGKACHTSQTTVVRLCKLAGYKGYKDFLLALAANLAIRKEPLQPLSYTDVQAGSNLAHIMEEMTKRNIGGIESTMQVLDYHELEKAVQAIHHARRVDFYGMGMSGLVALDAQNKFLRINKISLTTLDPHVQVVSASSLQKGDAAVFFSYSGETSDTLDTLKVARQGGATAISVTKYAPNTLSERCDTRLHVACSEGTVRTGATSSRIAMLHIVDLLFSAVTSLEYEEAKTVLDRSLAAASMKKNR